ncbi:unnamed protein product [Ambrosiozyma monospora]|uniref:Unnamed protein product n=1 Tax=Ambrosiozyma monospora TaxID=43982 RepID=A0ACB5TC52_AMBMO|nr:unnamed protein product [Ambrosiozyma monospora]
MLQNLQSLKTLCLSGDSLDASFLSMILPSNLKTLEVKTKELPQIYNMKDLRDLKEVNIHFIFDVRQMPFRDDFKRVQLSIDRLPSTINKLKMSGFIETTKQFSFKNLAGLKILHIGSCDFDSSSLISLRSLTVSEKQIPTIFGSSIFGYQESKDPFKFTRSGQNISPSPLVERLESLTIFMNYEGFTLHAFDFWRSFILPLGNLLELTIHQFRLSSNMVIEEYPPHLVFLQLDFEKEIAWGEVVLHGFDKTLRYIHLEGSGYVTLKQERNSKTLTLSQDRLDERFTEVDHTIIQDHVFRGVRNVKIVLCVGLRLYV